MPHRPRPARQAYGPYAQSWLASWRQLVRRVESGLDASVIGCPACDGSDGLVARNELEQLIRRGGRRAARLAAQVHALDERFRRATVPQPFAPLDDDWWNYRHLD
jgi:hypothetical protein